MRILKSICAVVLVLASAALAFGQMIPTGQLNGTVTDSDNSPLPGVNVTISSPSLMLPQLATVTNENGLYRFFSLPAGTYKVTFELAGFRGVVREGIILSGSRTVTVDISLEQGGIEESITVVGQSPTVDLKMTQTGTTFTKDMIASPAPGARSRRPSSTRPPACSPGPRTAATPGPTTSSSTASRCRTRSRATRTRRSPGTPSTRSRSRPAARRPNTAPSRAPWSMSSPRPAATPSPADSTSTTGARALQSDNTAGTPFEGQFVGFRHQYLPGFSLGGPIVKDKIWFFTSLDVDKSSSYTQGFPAPATSGGPQPPSAPIGQDTIAPVRQGHLPAQREGQAHRLRILARLQVGPPRRQPLDGPERQRPRGQRGDHRHGPVDPDDVERPPVQPQGVLVLPPSVPAGQRHPVAPRRRGHGQHQPRRRRLRLVVHPPAGSDEQRPDLVQGQLARHPRVQGRRRRRILLRRHRMRLLPGSPFRRRLPRGLQGRGHLSLGRPAQLGLGRDRAQTEEQPHPGRRLPSGHLVPGPAADRQPGPPAGLLPGELSAPEEAELRPSGPTSRPSTL